jgi:hypothetical protein
MIKSTYKKRKRSETLLKKGATVGVITAAGVIEAKSGFKGTKIAAKGIQKGVEVGSKGLKSVKDFAGGISKTFKDTMNPPAPKKIPKSHRLNAGNLQHDKLTPKPKLLGPGSGVDKPATIHPPAPKKPVRRGQGGQPKPPKMTVPKLTGGVVLKSAISCNNVSCAWTLVPITNPKLVLAPLAVDAPVPPLATAKSVPDQFELLTVVVPPIAVMVLPTLVYS